MTGSVPLREESAESRRVFEALYQSYFSEIYAYVLRRRRSEDVDDLVAEVFAVVWRRIDALPPKPEDRWWLYGVARNVLSQDLRTQTRRQSLVRRLSRGRAAPVVPVEGEESELSERLRVLIEHMKPFDREVVRLVAWDGLTHAEVAQIFGCSVNTVAIRWHRSIERLRKAMDRDTSEEFPSTVRDEVHDGD